MYRKAWIGYVVAMVVVLAGFAPDFGAGARPLDGLHLLHGGFATAWILLLVVQGWLIGYRHNRIHKVLGWTSVAIVPVFVASGLAMERAMLGSPVGLPESTELKLLWLDAWTLALFLGLYLAAMLTRKRMVDHARYMTATVIILLPPAIGRLLAAPLHGIEPTLLPITLMLSAVVAALMVSDWRGRKLLHPAYVATLVFVILVQLTYPITTTPGFAAFGRWVGGV